MKEVVNPLGYVEAIEINYLTLYTHNAPYTVLGFFKCGEHTGDWEHMTVRLVQQISPESPPSSQKDSRPLWAVLFVSHSEKTALAVLKSIYLMV